MYLCRGRLGCYGARIEMGRLQALLQGSISTLLFAFNNAHTYDIIQGLALL